MYVAKIQLPSNGKYGVTHVMLKRPTIGDLREYLSFKGSSVLIKNQLIERLCNVDLSGYPVGDREYVFVTIRGMVSAPIITDVFTCNKEGCEGEVDYKIDIREVKIHELPSSFIKDYKLVFPVCKKEKIVNIMTVEKESLLHDYIQVYEDAGVGGSFQHIGLGEDLMTFAEKACMFGDTMDFDSMEKNITFLLDLDFTDFEVLELYDIVYQCGPEILAKAACPVCKKEYRIALKTDSAFFGLSWESMMRKHQFLSRHSSNSFDDYLKFTIQDLDNAYQIEKEVVKAQNAAIKKQRTKK